VTVPTISRAVSRAELTFGLAVGRTFSPFLTIRIVFFSDIASYFGFSVNSYLLSTKLPPLSSKILKARTWTPDFLAKKRPHLLTRKRNLKRATFFALTGKYFVRPGVFARKPYTHRQQSGT
jgi:hypothetical protein